MQNLWAGSDLYGLLPRHIIYVLQISVLISACMSDAKPVLNVLLSPMIIEVFMFSLIHTHDTFGHWERWSDFTPLETVTCFHSVFALGDVWVFTRLMGSAAVSNCKYWRAALQDVVRREIYIYIYLEFSVETNNICMQSGKRHAFELIRTYSLHCFTAFI